VLCSLFASQGVSQGSQPATSAIERPQDRLRDVELPAPLSTRPERVLPEIPRPSLGEIQGDDPEVAVRVLEVVFSGNTALSDAVLRAAIEDFIGRALAAEGLEALRRRVTEVYVEAGYVNSGAVIPKQSLADGRLEVALVEGSVEAVRLEGLRFYREDVLRDRVLRGLGTPLNVEEVENQLRLLDQDPRIERVNAKLRPGSSRSAAILEIGVVEADRRRLRLAFDNDESPSVGAYAGRLGLANTNVFGLGDRFDARLTRTEGLTRIAGNYEIPLNARGTRLIAEASYGMAELVNDVFRRLEVETSDASFGLGLGQSLWRTPSDEIDLSVLFERRRSKTLLLGEGESFTPGPQNGRSEISVWRVGGDWTHRGLSSVFAMRSIVSFGTDWGNPTISSGDAPDGIFVSWFGQARGIYRFDRSGIEARLRADLQLSDRRLLPLEQFAIGGSGSVRGFRRNQLVRDQGFSAAFDLFVPVWRAADSRPIVALTPFVDVGRAWNRGRGATQSQTLTGLGLGLEWRPFPQLSFAAEWAHGFDHTGTSGDLQDESVLLRAQWRAF
jgi:hemolysin activation/secretion protein